MIFHNINNIKIMGNLPNIFGQAANAPIINTNLKIWLKADTGVTYDGSNLVSQWNDQSGNTNNAIQSTTSYKPLYVATDSILNNKPAIRFDAATDKFLSIPYSSTFNFSSTGFTIYVVSKINSFYNTFDMLIQHSNGSTWTQGWGILYYTTDNGYRFFVNNWNNVSNYILLANTNTTKASIFKFKYDLSTITAQIISSLQSSSNTKAYTGGITTPTSNALEIMRGGLTIYDTNGDTPEILIYNSGNLGASAETQIENYLKIKYAI